MRAKIGKMALLGLVAMVCILAIRVAFGADPASLDPSPVQQVKNRMRQEQRDSIVAKKAIIHASLDRLPSEEALSKACSDARKKYHNGKRGLEDVSSAGSEYQKGMGTLKTMAEESIRTSKVAAKNTGDQILKRRELEDQLKDLNRQLTALEEKWQLEDGLRSRHVTREEAPPPSFGRCGTGQNICVYLPSEFKACAEAFFPDVVVNEPAVPGRADRNHGAGTPNNENGP